MQTESPYTLAHRVLLNAQQQNGGTLGVSQVQDKLQSTPGMLFTPGTTVEKVLENLERWGLVEMMGERVRVLPR
jgi:hypothetical protein